MKFVAEQTLVLANDLFEGFANRKRTTIRLGRRNIELNELSFISTDPVTKEEAESYVRLSPSGFVASSAIRYPDKPLDDTIYLCENVFVITVTYIRARDMTDLDAQADGFDDVEDMLEGMLRFYPDMSWDSELTIIEFETEADLL